MDKGNKKTDGWIRVASKSCPGRFYLFNKSTGETKWLPTKKDVDEEEKQERQTLPKLKINKASLTPAQDRLKRLQHNLKMCQTKTNTHHTQRLATDLKAQTTKEQENSIKDNPSTSLTAKNYAKSHKKATNNLESSRFSNEVVNSSGSCKSSILGNSKKLRVSDSLKLNSSNSLSNEFVNLKPAEQATSNILEDVQNLEDNSLKLNNLRSGIVKKIKEICKIPFNLSKKLSSEKLFSKKEKSPSLNNTIKFKANKSTNIKKYLSTSATQDFNIKQIEHVKKQYLEKTDVTELSTPKNLNIPSYPRGSANTRLKQLRQSLIPQDEHEQHQSIYTTNNNTDTLSQISNLSAEIIHHKIEPLPTGHNCNKSINFTFSTANCVVEAMDWQPILKDEEKVEKFCLKPCLVVENSQKLLFEKIKYDENQSLGDIIDTVNENLLRFSAEKQKYSTNNKKWHTDFYYFIVDTNVLLRDLTFVEDLSKMKLCDTKGSILYIPYSVLQELDKLKMRSGSQDGVKTLAVRAIKYLNSKFESNSSHLQAQSAFDERHRLVDISSADDSIINCCLQAKEHVPNLLLLTEDINLRNKAICNNIMVSTKSDLLAKRYNSSVKS